MLFVHVRVQALIAPPPLRAFTCSILNCQVAVQKPKITSTCSTKHLFTVRRGATIGCPSRTKFWSSDFCFEPKLNLGLDNFFFLDPSRHVIKDL